MVFGLSKKERQQNAKEQKIYQKTLAEERLKNAPRIAVARAKAEADAEIARSKGKAKRGGGILGTVAAIGSHVNTDYASVVMGSPPRKSRKKHSDPFESFY